jgi:hypothetical protein
MIMKKLILILILLFCAFTLIAQVPQAFSYKALIKGNSGHALLKKPVTIKISIIQGNIENEPVYIEKHKVSTSSAGIVDLEIGRGEPESGLFTEINWKTWPYFVKSEIDLKGGRGYQLIAVTELLTVPYAMYAAKSANDFSGDYNDLVNKPVIPGKTSELINDSGYLTEEVDGDITNEIQSLSVSKYGDTLRLSKSNWVLVPGISDANHCFPNLPSPVLAFERIEEYWISGVKHLAYHLDVLNWSAFPNELFDPSPELPPCGINTNSARTWVDIYDNNHVKLYGFCALTSSANLNNIWFGKQIPPDSVYIVIKDRRCNIEYTSNMIKIPKTGLGAIHDPVLEIQFNENPYNHNMHITSDGNYYYTINGGDYSNGLINKFDLNGNLITSYPVKIDGRGLSYNKSDGLLYASVFGGSIVKITNLANGTFEIVHSAIMQNVQASFAISADGTKFYDFYNGTLNIRSMSTGSILGIMSGLNCGSDNYDGNAAVAVDPDYIYTWDASEKVVYVYRHDGGLERTLNLSYGNNGHSLSFVDGFLFISKDAWYSTGTWYGYNIRKELSGIKTTGVKELPKFNPIKIKEKTDTSL